MHHHGADGSCHPGPGGLLDDCDLCREAQECACCELGDYDPAPEDHDVPGSCLNCGHSPEEHEEP